MLAVSLAVGGVRRRRSPFRTPPEYEEEIYLALDGTATVNVNASIASLVALRGVNLRRRSAGARRSRRGAALLRRPRRAGDERQPGRAATAAASRTWRSTWTTSARSRKLAPFAWSRYRFEPRGDIVEFEQTVGAAVRPCGHRTWAGTAARSVSFRMHVPSEIVYHNTDGVQRGNILEWDQPLAARLKGEALALQVNMEPRSILYSTLLLFGGHGRGRGPHLRGGDLADRAKGPRGGRRAAL